MNRSLLILTIHFPPSAASGSHRLLGFVRHLPRFGWGAAVIAPPSTRFETVDPELSRRVPPGTALYPAPFPWTRALRPLRAVSPVTAYWIDSARWAGRVAAAARRALREQPIGAMLTSGPPHDVHILGLRLHRQTGLPWVADFRDPWIATGNYPRFTRHWEARMERRVMAEADAIVANAPAARDRFREAFPESAGKIVTITNGYDPETFDDLPRRPDPEGRWTITHPGQLYGGRDPGPLLDALQALLADWPAGRPRPRLRLLGRQAVDAPDQDLDEQARRRGLEGVVAAEGQVPHRASLQAMVDADVLLLMDAAGRKQGVPAKLYEYLGAGRPVLALGEPDGDTAWVLRASGVEYRIAPPGDAPAIHRALRELLASGADAGPAPGRLEFTRERLVGRLAGLLDELTGSASGGANDPASTHLDPSPGNILLPDEPVRQ